MLSCVADVALASGLLTARIATLGAELQSLRDDRGRELMSSGDPDYWAGRAPLLFPIVGRLNGDSYRLGDRRHPMPKHGFARRSEFAVVEAGPSRAVLRLVDNETTMAIYPFAFELDIAFSLDDATLSIAVTIRNRSEAAMPASFGFHPAFAWPLPFGQARADHGIMFERDEPGGLAAITPAGLIAPEPRATPVMGRTLALHDDLFTQDALVWRTLASKRLRYGVAGAGELEIAFPDTPSLGIWTKPGARFVCVEPWAGIADDAGFDGDFRAKPGVFEIAPQAEHVVRMTVTLVPPTP